MQSEQNEQLIMRSNQTFVVNVKTLSNQVHQFHINPNIAISELKRLVQAKTNFPVDRQRLIFSGKQLLDTSILSDYIKESGVVIHLLAKSSPNPQQNIIVQNQQNLQMMKQPLINFRELPRVQNQRQQGVQITSLQTQKPVISKVPNFANIYSSLMRASQDMGNDTQTKMSVEPVTKNYLPQQVNNHIETSSFNPPPKYKSLSIVTQQNQTNNPSIYSSLYERCIMVSPRAKTINPSQQSYSTALQSQQIIGLVQIAQKQSHLPLNALNNLHMAFNRNSSFQERLMIPENMNPKQETMFYLRKLHNQTLKFLPQLNRSVQLLSSGRVTHMVQFLSIFRLLNVANQKAIDVIQNMLQTEGISADQQTSPLSSPANCLHQTSFDEKSQQNFQQISQRSPTNFSKKKYNSNRLQPENCLDMISEEKQYLIAQTQSPKSTLSNRKFPQTQPLKANYLQNQLNSTKILAQSYNGQTAQKANIMSLYGQIQQNGGIGELMSMSVGNMIDQNAIDPIYWHILQVVSGGEIIGIFTAKNFSFLNNKKNQLREAFLKAISSVGSKQQLVNQYAENLSTVFIPTTQIKNKQLCIKKVNKIFKGRIERIITIILQSSGQLDVQNAILSQLKLLFCETVAQISKFCLNTQLVFSSLKCNIIPKIDKFAQGMAQFFYSIVERDLIRIYREYSSDAERRRQRSQQQAKDESELLRQILNQSQSDVEYMASYKHSRYYPLKQ